MGGGTMSSAGGAPEPAAAPAELMGAADPNVLDTTAAGGLMIRGGMLRFGSYVGVVGLSVLSAALLTRYLAPTGFSQYTTVLSLVGLIAIVTDAGMSNLAVREFSVGEGAERDALMRDLLGLRVALTTSGWCSSRLLPWRPDIARRCSGNGGRKRRDACARAAAHAHDPAGGGAAAGRAVALELARQALTMIAIVRLIVLGAGVFPLLAVTLVVYVVLIPVTARLARDGSRCAWTCVRDAGAAARLTVAFSLATAVGAVYVYTAQIITSLVASGHQSGLFAASFRVFMVASPVPGLLVSGAIPLLASAARDDRDRLGYALQRIFEVSLILGIGAALGTLAGAQFIIKVVAGPEFAASAGLLIQGLAFIASFLVAGWSFALLSLKRYRVSCS